MVEIKEISKGLYKIKNDNYPIFFSIRKGDVRLTQPIDKNYYDGRVKFDEDKYFGQGYPQELIIPTSQIGEVLEVIKKVLVIENL